MAKSLIDYIFRFLGSRFLSAEAERRSASSSGIEPQRRARPRRGPPELGSSPYRTTSRPRTPPTLGFSPQADAPSCPDCGSIMMRNGSCYKCLNCGATSGCS